VDSCPASCDCDCQQIVLIINMLRFHVLKLNMLSFGSQPLRTTCLVSMGLCSFTEGAILLL